ncbi:MAG: hypothetical protein VX278_08990, partial [Myxococcota bacterium]|nr:hypothetical protein [Myxococcota bacterium]
GTSVLSFVEKTLTKQKETFSSKDKDRVLETIGLLAEPLSRLQQQVYAGITARKVPEKAHILSYDALGVLRTMEGVSWTKAQDAKLEGSVRSLVQLKGLDPQIYIPIFNIYLTCRGADISEMQAVYRNANAKLRQKIAESVAGDDRLSSGLIEVAKNDLASMTALSKEEASRIDALKVEAENGSVVSIQQLARLGQTQILLDVFKSTFGREDKTVADSVVASMALLRSEAGEAVLSEIQSNAKYIKFHYQAKLAAKRSEWMRTPYPRSR